MPMSVSYHSVLSQDFITSNGVLVDGSSIGQVAVFRNPRKDGAVEALVISDAGGQRDQLFYLAHDSASLTGWSLTPVLGAEKNPVFASEVLAFTTTWGAVDAFYISTGGHLGHLWIDVVTGEWTPTSAVEAAPIHLSRLGVAFSPGASASAGALLVYALDPGGKVFFYYSAKGLGKWSASTLPLGGPSSSWTIALRDESHWLLSMVAARDFTFDGTSFLGIGGTSVEKGQVGWCWGTVTGDKVKVEGVKVDHDHQADRVVFNATDMTGTSSTLMLSLAGDKDARGGHQVAWLRDPGTAAQAYGTIAGTSFIDATIVKSTGGYVNIYGRDPAWNLFALRQIGWNPGDMSSGYGAQQTWGPVLQLDSRIQRVYADPSPSDRPTLVAVDADVGALHLYVQDPSTSLWLTVPITLPSTAHNEISRWRTEINVQDENGQPMPDARLVLEAQSAVDIEVNGRYCMIDSGAGATITTNSLGKATISSLASSLAAPAFTVVVDGLPPQPQHSPSGAINAYLAGSGSLYGKDAFDAAAVAKLSPGSPVDPNTAHTAIQQCAQLGFGQTAHPSAAALLRSLRETSTPVHVYLHAGDRVLHQPCTDRAEADSFLAENLASSSVWTDVWDATKHFAGDVWHGIRQGIHKVTSVVVDLGKAVVSLVVQIGDSLVKLADFLIQGVEDALQAITAVFNWIRVEIDTVIKWLKMLFDFQAIWNTKEGLKTQMLRLPDYLIGQVQSLSQLIEGDFFRRQKAVIDGFFSTAIARFDGQSFDQLAGWTPMGQPPSTTSPLVGSLTPGDLTRNASVNWMQDKVSSNAPATIQGVPEADGDPVQAFFHALVDAGEDLLRAFTDFGSGITALLAAGSVDSFEKIAISTFLGLAKDLMDALLDLIDALIQGLLALVTLAMDGIKTLLSTELHLGFINDIYAWIAGKVGGSTRLTMGDLVALIAAFPVTIVYKMIAGVDHEPFPGGRPPTSDALAAGAVPSTTVRQVLATVAGVLTAVGGVWSTAGDMMTTPPAWLTPVSVVTSVIRLAFTHPYYLDWGPLQFEEAAAVAGVLFWLGPAAYAVVSALNVSERVQDSVVGKLRDSGLTTWVFGDVAKVGLTAFGGFMFCTTIYLVVSSETPPLKMTADILESIVGPLSFLTMTPIRDLPDIGLVSVFLKVGIDVVAGLDGSALEIASAWTESAG